MGGDDTPEPGWSPASRLAPNPATTRSAPQFSRVDCPLPATPATTQLPGTGTLALPYNQTATPTTNGPGTLVVNNTAPALGETLLLTTASNPRLAPGQRYYLGVYNTNAAPGATNLFSLCVNFDQTDTNVFGLVTLSNNVPITNTITGGATGLPGAARALAAVGAEAAARPAINSMQSPTSTSATPRPSVPGSHAATKAFEALISGFTHSGRPDRNTDTTGMPCARRCLIRSRSVGSPGANASVGTSPWNSA